MEQNSSEQVYANRQAKYGVFKDNLVKYYRLRESMQFHGAGMFSDEVVNGVELVFQLISLKAFRWQYCKDDDNIYDFVNYFFMLKELGVEAQVDFDEKVWSEPILECINEAFTLSKKWLEQKLLECGLLREVKNDD